MTDTRSRIFGLLLVMVAIWTAVYWLWEPSRQRITVDDTRGDSSLSIQSPGTSTRPAPLVSMDEPAPVQPPTRTDLVELPTAPPTPTPSPAPAPTPEPIDPPATRKVAKVIKPEFREYVVQAGDVSWERIAGRKEVYGDRKLWRAVAKANPLTTSDRLRPGAKLKIAVDPTNIQEGKVVWVDEPIPGAKPSKDKAPGKSVNKTESAEITYEIKGDDTLWSIAKQFYGSGAKWRRIYEANRDVIKNPDRPPAGATIRVPQDSGD